MTKELLYETLKECGPTNAAGIALHIESRRRRVLKSRVVSEIRLVLSRHPELFAVTDDKWDILCREYKPREDPEPKTPYAIVYKALSQNGPMTTRQIAEMMDCPMMLVSSIMLPAIKLGLVWRRRIGNTSNIEYVAMDFHGREV